MPQPNAGADAQLGGGFADGQAGVTAGEGVLDGPSVLGGLVAQPHAGTEVPLGNQAGALALRLLVRGAWPGSCAV